jgi:hypothetical protein
MKPEFWKRLTYATPVLAFVLLSACGGKEAIPPVDIEQQAFDDLREKVVVVITDSDRQAKVSGLVDELQVDFESFRIAVTERRLELRKLNSDYDATREQFSEYVDRYNKQIMSSRDKVTESRLALIRATTPEEWDQLQNLETKIMKKLVESIHAI